jgi:hypothetical protein
MATYTVKIDFNTDRTLTDNELDQLLTNVRVQIEEPADELGNDAEFITSNITMKSEIAFCFFCKATNDLMTENERDEQRAAGWVGVDFYDATCLPCFNTYKEER